MQSNLSSTGYDYVVAVIQDSVNATLEASLRKGLAEVIICYVYDENDPSNVVLIDYAALVKSASNTDPFSVPAGTSGKDTRVQNLANAGFAFAIKTKFGLPPGVRPANLPPIIALKPGQSNVTYTLVFAEFVATEISYGPRNSLTWFSQSQPSGTAWTFSGSVDLNFADTSFTELPADVQARLKAAGDPAMFGVRQLFFDLNSTELVQTFTFNQIPSNSALNAFMTDNFVDTYFRSLKGGEILGYVAQQVSVTPPSSVAVTDVNFFTPAAVGTGAPLTLNYLCAANGNPLPATTHAGFGWDWIDAGESPHYHGVAALNRNALARYLSSAVLPGGGTLLSYAMNNCYLPWVTVTYEGGLQVKYDFGVTTEQTPTVSFPPSGSTLLTYSYDSDDQWDRAGDNGFWGRMDLRCTYGMTVAVENNEIVITQHLGIWTYVKYMTTDGSGNVVDKQITDTYIVGVDDSGRLTTKLKQSYTATNSQTPGANGFLTFWSDYKKLADKVTQWAQSIVATRLTDLPVSFAENFVFPGGSTFSFTDANFSANSDLVSHITYADVS